jgi:MoaA/NifB/PqqE/SkfB family radical SAM enzyme
VPLKEIKKRLEQLKNSGIKRVALGGGEVTLHPELAEIIIFGRELGLTLGATTSGQVPLSEHTRSSLNLLHQLNVSLDGLASIYQQSRRSAGAETALELIRSLSKQNTVRVGINLLLTRMTLPGLEETVAAAVEAGARDIQLLRLKPVGRAFKNYQENRLQPMDVAGLWERIQALIRRFPGVLFRGDCSMVPLFSLSPIDPHRLQAFAGAGCHGGDALFSIAPSGQKTPCSFWKGPLDNDWKSGPAQKPCQDCSWRALCRGGCHAVSGSALLPDPECPRVMACQS